MLRAWGLGLGSGVGARRLGGMSVWRHGGWSYGGWGYRGGGM